MSLWVMIDGQLLSPEQATVSVFDRGFLYGDSVFETIRTYQGKPYALQEHLARLRRSAARVYIDVPVSDAELQAEVQRLLAHRAQSQAGSPESYLRIMLTRGQGEMGLDPALAERPTRVLIAGPLHPPAAQAYERGISVITFKTQRAADATDAEGAKIGNYLVAVLAMRAAKAAGATEALIVDREERVIEGASSNLFYVVEGCLHTPPLEAGILAGVTRAGVLQAAAALGVQIKYALPTKQELYAAPEVFISSSIRELLAVVQIDEHRIGSGQVGPVTRSLHTQFKRQVAQALQLPSAV